MWCHFLFTLPRPLLLKREKKHVIHGHGHPEEEDEEEVTNSIYIWWDSGAVIPL